MNDTPPTTRRASWWRPLIFIAIAATVLAVLLYLDPRVYQRVKDTHTENKDWHRFFRVMGWLPTWLIAGAAMTLIDWRHVSKLGWRVFSRFILLNASVLCTAGLSELLKVLIRRRRPLDTEGLFAMRDWADHTFRSSGLSMPSGHAAVAFGACFMLCYIFPRASIVWVGLAVGCGLTRILAGAHFPSDVFVSAVLGWVIARLIWRHHVKTSAPWHAIAPDAVPGPRHI